MMWCVCTDCYQPPGERMDDLRRDRETEEFRKFLVGLIGGLGVVLAVWLLIGLAVWGVLALV